MRCLKCGKETPNGNFCRNCGAPIPKKKPLYKRWWFWVSAPVALFFLSAFVSAGVDVASGNYTPEPSSSAEPTATLAPSYSTPEVRYTPKQAPTAAPTPINTPEPSATLPSVPAETPKPTERPVDTPRPTEKSMPEDTPKPTQEPTPEPTPEPTATPPYGENYHGHVYASATGSKYHYENPCGSGEYHEITWDDVRKQKLEPCGKCVLH
jgi:putative uncharacterized protein M409R